MKFQNLKSQAKSWRFPESATLTRLHLHCYVLTLGLSSATSLGQQQPPSKGILEAMAMSQLGSSIDLYREL